MLSFVYNCHYSSDKGTSDYLQKACMVWPVGMPSQEGWREPFNSHLRFQPLLPWPPSQLYVVCSQLLESQEVLD